MATAVPNTREETPDIQTEWLDLDDLSVEEDSDSTQCENDEEEPMRIIET